MKPEQFIREFGEKKAREVVEGAIYPIFGYDPVGMNYIHKQCDVAPVRYNPNCNSWSEDYAIETILIEDLKRLVESLDRITQRGGLSKTKDHLDYLISFGSEFAGVSKDEIKELQQDVAVHESIYGGGDE